MAAAVPARRHRRGSRASSSCAAGSRAPASISSPTPDGDKIAGNVESVPAGVLDRDRRRRRRSSPTCGSTRRARRRAHAALVRVVGLPDGVAHAGRARRQRERAAGRGRAPLADPDRRADGGARADLLDVRLAARAEADRFDRRDEPAHRGRRPLRPARGDRHRRRVRPPRREPQHHARPHRAADARPEAGLRQHRARPEDAADAHAQPRRGGAGAGARASPTIARRCRRRSRRRTSSSAPSTRC